MSELNALGQGCQTYMICGSDRLVEPGHPAYSLTGGEVGRMGTFTAVAALREEAQHRCLFPWRQPGA